jgi:hypothetical protein
VIRETKVANREGVYESIRARETNMHEGAIYMRGVLLREILDERVAVMVRRKAARVERCGTVWMIDEQHQEVPDYIIGANTGPSARRCDHDGFKGRL